LRPGSSARRCSWSTSAGAAYGPTTACPRTGKSKTRTPTAFRAHRPTVTFRSAEFQPFRILIRQLWAKFAHLQDLISAGPVSLLLFACPGEAAASNVSAMRHARQLRPAARGDIAGPHGRLERPTTTPFSATLVSRQPRLDRILPSPLASHAADRRRLLLVAISAARRDRATRPELSPPCSDGHSPIFVRDHAHGTADRAQYPHSLASRYRGSSGSGPEEQLRATPPIGAPCGRSTTLACFRLGPADTPRPS